MRYKKRFPDFHRGMLHIRRIFNFKYVLIHCGNKPRDTRACQLPGRGHTIIKGKPNVSFSTNAYKQLYSKITPRLLEGEKVFITIKDEEAT